MASIYEIKPSPGKGMGVFSAVDLNAGDVIIRDDAYMRILEAHNSVTSEQVEAAFDSLSQDLKGQFLQLHEGPEEYIDATHTQIRISDCDDEQEAKPMQEAFSALSSDFKNMVLELSGKNENFNSKIMRIYRKNSWIDNENGVDGLIYFNISRVNHSCLPNSEIDISKSTGMGKATHATLLATRHIRKGEEVFVSYSGSVAGGSRALRQQFLNNKYGFVCQCVTCRLTGAELSLSDARRGIIAVLYAQWWSFSPTSDELNSVYDCVKREHCSRPEGDLTDQERVTYAFLLARLMEAEGLSSHYVSEAYFVAAAILLAQINDLETIIVLPAIKLVEEWFELAINRATAATGMESEKVKTFVTMWKLQQERSVHVHIGKETVEALMDAGTYNAVRTFAVDLDRTDAHRATILSKDECLALVKKATRVRR